MRSLDSGPVPAPDPLRDPVVRRPERAEPGYWVGGPSVLWDAATQRCLLTYRDRRPRGTGDDRGWRNAIAVSQDGIRFQDIWEVHKQELDTPSMERFCLHRRPDGCYQLYLSYVDPADNRWRIDVTESDTPDGFDVSQRRPVLTAATTGTEGVKDPRLVALGGAPVPLVMMVSAAVADLAEDDRVAAHRTADIFNTGLARSVTALAESFDEGASWRWHGTVLAPGTGWDRWASRITGVLPVAGGYVGYYDGAAHHRDNYEEKTGLVHSVDLRTWKRLSVDSPAFVSPHSTGSLRYVDVVRFAPRAHLYYELACSGGEHELRVHVSEAA